MSQNNKQNQFCQNNDSGYTQKSNTQSIRLSDLRNQKQKVNGKTNSSNRIIINDKYTHSGAEVINETFEEKFENDQSMLQRKERNKEC